MNSPTSAAAFSLDDKYDLARARVFISGTQAIVRLLLEQRRRDLRAGYDTAGFVSGYRGSPLGGLDSALWQAGKRLAAQRVHFEPGLNEELAATAVAGSQQAGIAGAALRAGVFGLWYAKNPGVDRAGDALKHANAAGTAPLGGVLAFSGDDPGATSSSMPNQCDQAFMSALMPFVSPATVGEIVEQGLLGYALSRYCGLWIGVKTVADVVESSAIIALDETQPVIAYPADHALPAGGLGIRLAESRWDQDARLLEHRLPAAKAFAHANRLDRIVFGSTRPRLGIVASGKAYLDTRQALEMLGIDGARAQELELGVYKVGMPWPLEPRSLREFALGLDEIFVVEERRSFIEMQMKEQAFNWPAAQRPLIVGKTDEFGAPLLPEAGELSASRVALALGNRLRRRGVPLAGPLARIEQALQPPRASMDLPARVPHFCSGCPHARSTRVPEGSFAMGGIGCHSLRLWMPDSATRFLLQMGGEGANWIGLAPFVDAKHVFQNLGDGTYAHSGSLSIRAAVAARLNITFRLLYNEATAMTGGQPVEGMLSVPQITRQLHAEGVGRIAVVTDQPDKYAADARFAPGSTLHHRDEFDRLQRELREVPGVTALVYDQVCATEKRRRRKRGELPRASRRAFINERVCEGCGDCVEQSQCAAVMPVDTPLGRKRRIDQSACNVDLSCLNGFCPSFVTVEGGLRRAEGAAPAASPDASPAPLAQPYAILIDGIGGSGVITLGAILGTAANLEGKACTVLDNTGIARKGGAVSTHVRLARDPAALHAARIADRGADLVLACDVVASAAPTSLAKIEPGATRVVINADALPTLNQRLDPDCAFDAAGPGAAIARAAGDERCDTVGASTIAEHLVGDSIYANMVMLGYAYQRGWVPLGLAAIDRAIEMNGTEIEDNRRAFAWGRHAAHDRPAVDAALGPYRDAPVERSLDVLLEQRSAFLTAYQDAAYAARYRNLVARARAAAARLAGADESLARAVASGFFRLLAYKDEYEVARLYSDGAFGEALKRRFAGRPRLHYHLAPPFFARRDPLTGHLRKRAYGPWIATAFGWLARLRRLRGTWLDPFGHTDERRRERGLIVEYENTIDELLGALGAANLRLAVEIALLPERIRGFGHVKQKNLAAANRRRTELLAEFRRLGAAHGAEARG
ncbi:MAG: indolepyruvate ferredoxin oxidoreductase family protein [Betaproteobacteria bacterium]|nr:indolepyruvate ferredoxin oxidoreductase family protein [Betaproteobacteria bacterium]